MMKYLRILVCGFALQCSALPALANFNMSPSGSTIAFAIDSGNQGTALCAAGSTECPASVPINTAGAPLFVTGNAGLVTGVGGTFPVTQTTAANLNATVVGTGTFAVQATQAGTWTIQPGNTANTTAWLVTGTGGVFPATQSGNWMSRVVGNTGTVLDFPGQNAGTPGASLLTGCQFNTSPTTITNGNASPVQCDNAGNMLVNIKAGTVATTNAGTFAVQLTGATNNINNVSGTVSLPTGAATSALQTTGNTELTTINTTLGTPFQAGGSIGNTTFAVTNAGTFAAQLTGATNNLNNISGTISLPTGAATSANQTNASQKTQIVDGSGNVIAATSNNLNVQCANCSGSGVSTADAASFTPTVSLFAGGGGFFQTTATSNALTTGQQGMFQVTANRALFSNLRNAAGTEVGTAAAPLQVSIANTGANGTAVLVTGAGGTFPVTGTVTANAGTNLNTSLLALESGGNLATIAGAVTAARVQENVSQINGVTPLMGNGVTGTGSQRVTIASDNTAFSVNATLSAETTKVIGTVNQGTSPWVISGALTANQSVNVSQINGVTPLMGNGVTGTGSQRVTIASDNTAFSVNATSNTSQINGVTPLMGNGVTGTGSQRVTIASDNTAFSVNATLQASGGTAIGKVDPNTIGSWGIQASTQNSSTPTNGVLTLGQFNTTPTTITTGNVSPLQMDSAGNLLVNIKAGAGSGGTAIADKAAWTVSSTTFTLSGGEFTTGGATACTTGQACTVGMTASRGFFTDLSTVNAVTVLTGTGAVGTGAQRVAVGTDTATIAGSAPGTAGTASANVVTVQGIASMTKLLVTPDANSAVNVAQINGVTPLMGNGVTGTGSQRVTIASDNTAFSVNATLSAETTKVIGTARILGNAGAIVDFVGQAATAPANAWLTGAAFFTTPTTLTNGQASPLQIDSAANLLVNLKTAVPAGANLMGKVGLDQTTPGTTNAVSLAQIGANTVSTGNGVAGTGSQRVAIVSDNTVLPAVGAGATGAAVPANAAYQGSIYNSSPISAPTAGNLVGAQGDLNGNTKVAPGLTTQTLTAITSATGTGAVTPSILVNHGAPAVLLQLDQTSTVTGGAITIQGTYDGTNWVTVPTAQVLNPNTFAQLTNPYSFVASTNQPFLVMVQGYQAVRLNLTSALTGTATITPQVTQLPYAPGAVPGVAGAASPSVVTVQGIASMTKLLVTPDSVALPANQSVNVAQINGVTPLMGNGATGTGSPRVTISSDNSAVSGLGAVATGAAPPANAVYLGANASGATGGHVAGLISCDSHVFKHITTATDTLAVQGVASQTIYICGWRSRAAGTATWFLENTASTNANCSSANTQINGVASEVANSGENLLAPFWTGLKNTSGNGLCINSTGTGGVDVDVWYAQF